MSSARSSSRLGRDIELRAVTPDGGDSVRGYLSLAAASPRPAVLVIQERWGLVDHIRDVCDRLAREGFVAFAPDLYRGALATGPSEAERLMMDLDIPGAGADLDAAIVALLSRDETDGARIGCIGFCMGGQLALYEAARSERISAVVDCYGIHPNVAVDLSRIQARVLGIFAENDDFVPPAAAGKLEAELRAEGVDADFKVHAGVGHAFLDDARPDAYDAASAREAWSDILSFLRSALA
jgi:carboxymethylenebutenolidase